MPLQFADLDWEWDKVVLLKLFSSGLKAGMHATITPMPISMIDHCMMAFESVYVTSAEIVWIRIPWTMVTKKPAPKRMASEIWKRACQDGG